MSSEQPVNVVELVTFKLIATKSREDFLKASEGIEKFARAQPGFLYRSLCENPDGEGWTDIVYWQDMDCAKKAGSAFMDSSDTQPAVQCIDPATVSMQHLPVASAAMSESCTEEAESV